FGSKESLVVAVLERREQRWSRDWLEAEGNRRGGPPGQRLLAYFDIFDEWFRDAAYEGCLFTEALLESGDWKSPIGAASVAKLMNVRNVLRALAVEAGARDPERFAAEWQMLLWGAIVGASAGELDAAARARNIARLLLHREGIQSAE